MSSLSYLPNTLLKIVSYVPLCYILSIVEPRWTPLSITDTSIIMDKFLGPDRFQLTSIQPLHNGHPTIMDKICGSKLSAIEGFHCITTTPRVLRPTYGPTQLRHKVHIATELIMSVTCLRILLISSYENAPPSEETQRKDSPTPTWRSRSQKTQLGGCGVACAAPCVIIITLLAAHACQG